MQYNLGTKINQKVNSCWCKSIEWEEVFTDITKKAVVKEFVDEIENLAKVNNAEVEEDLKVFNFEESSGRREEMQDIKNNKDY